MPLSGCSTSGEWSTGRSESSSRWACASWLSSIRTASPWSSPRRSPTRPDPVGASHGVRRARAAGSAPLSTRLSRGLGSRRQTHQTICREKVTVSPTFEAEITPGIVDTTGRRPRPPRGAGQGSSRLGIYDVVFWHDCYVLMALVADKTTHVRLGPMVTNPSRGTRPSSPAPWRRCRTPRMAACSWASGSAPVWNRWASPTAGQRRRGARRSTRSRALAW